MTFIDTHAHLYSAQFDSDRPELLKAAEAGGVRKILLPAIDSTTHNAMLALEAQAPQCLAMMGLHPCSVQTDTLAGELKIVAEMLASRQFTAIGEIGLDFYWDKTFAKDQYAAFHQQLQWCSQYNLPAVIHSRNAIDECIAVVKEHPQTTGVFHCFSGSLAQAQQIIDAGWMLGIGGVVTFKNGGLDAVLPFIGLESILVETDAPYLAPVPYRGKRNQPGYLPIIAEKIAMLTDTELQNVANITTENAVRLFRLTHF